MVQPALRRGHGILAGRCHTSSALEIPEITTILEASFRTPLEVDGSFGVDIPPKIDVDSVISTDAVLHKRESMMRNYFAQLASNSAGDRAPLPKLIQE